MAPGREQPPCFAQTPVSRNPTEATEALRGLIDVVVLTPDEGALRIELRGNLAAMLSAATNAKRSPETGDLWLQVQMVAGAGFEPATFGL
jgi:site-specific DNA recombinase